MSAEAVEKLAKQLDRMMTDRTKALSVTMPDEAVARELAKAMRGKGYSASVVPGLVGSAEKLEAKICVRVTPKKKRPK